MYTHTQNTHICAVYSLWNLYKAKLLMKPLHPQCSGIPKEHQLFYYQVKEQAQPFLLCCVWFRDQTVSMLSPTGRWCQRVLEKA